MNMYICKVSFFGILTMAVNIINSLINKLIINSTVTSWEEKF